MGREGAELGVRVGKGERGLDLDICPVQGPRVPRYDNALFNTLGSSESLNSRSRNLASRN